nr:uncharacterized protein C7orf61 homolog isoform X1 [Saimiri boliviensis boliviensis]
MGSLPFWPPMAKQDGVERRERIAGEGPEEKKERPGNSLLHPFCAFSSVDGGVCPAPLSCLSSLCLCSQIFFWRQKMKPTMLEHPASKKHSLKKVKTLQVSETLRLVEPLKEAKLELGESPELPDACVLAKTAEGTEAELGRQGRSLLRLPRMAVKSVSMLMVSALQSGWQMCSWKSSVSSASVSSQVRTQSPLETPEAEMLWEVYLVLWAIRKQLQQLSRRQERRRRHHVRCHATPRPKPVQSLKLDAQSPL